MRQIEDLRGHESLRPQVTKAESARAFRQAASFGIADQRAVKPRGFNSAESAIEKNLPSGRCKKIRPTHHLGDAHGYVIDNHGEFVGWDVVAIPNEKIPKIAQGVFFDDTEILILERNDFVVGNPEAPVHTRGLLERVRFTRISSPFHRKDRFILMRSEG